MTERAARTAIDRRSIAVLACILLVAGCSGSDRERIERIERRVETIERATINQMRVNRDQEERIVRLEKEVLLRIGEDR